MGCRSDLAPLAPHPEMEAPVELKTIRLPSRGGAAMVGQGGRPLNRLPVESLGPMGKHGATIKLQHEAHCKRRLRTGASCSTSSSFETARRKQHGTIGRRALRWPERRCAELCQVGSATRGPNKLSFLFSETANHSRVLIGNVCFFRFFGRATGHVQLNSGNFLVQSFKKISLPVC